MYDQPFATPNRLNREARLVLGLSCMNFVALCVISYLLYGVSERWWVGTVLTYAPRSPFIVPTVALLVASLFWHRGSTVINLVSAAIVLVPIMGFCVSFQTLQAGSGRLDRQSALKIVSCNVQEFRPNFAKVLEEISVINPDVIALQEALSHDPLLERQYPDWHSVRLGNLWVGSRYPVSLISPCEVTQFEGRLAGIVVEIRTPTGPILLGNVHQMTARRGLTELSRRSLVNGDGTRELEAFEGERYLESIELRAGIDKVRAGRPIIVCGDFNTPVSSSLFQRHWGDLQSAFDIAGFGFGYTSPCKGNRYWPNNLPWARIDHILCSKEWSVRQCQIGQSDGSDHRLISATLTRPALTSVAKTISE